MLSMTTWLAVSVDSCIVIKTLVKLAIVIFSKVKADYDVTLINESWFSYCDKPLIVVLDIVRVDPLISIIVYMLKSRN